MTLVAIPASHLFGISFISPGDLATAVNDLAIAVTSGCIGWGMKSNVCALPKERYYIALSTSEYRPFERFSSTLLLLCKEIDN